MRIWYLSIWVLAVFILTGISDFPVKNSRENAADKTWDCSYPATPSILLANDETKSWRQWFNENGKNHNSNNDPEENPNDFWFYPRLIQAKIKCCRTESKSSSFPFSAQILRL